MKKHFILFSIFLSIVFIIGIGCESKETYELPVELQYPETELPSEIKNCEGVLHNPDAIPFSDRDLCYYELAMEFESPNICSRIESETFDDDCYKVLAERMRDYRICGEIDPDGNMGLCYLEFLEEMPVGIEFCEYLTYPGHWDSCITKMAAIVPNLDYEICDDVTTFLGERNTCYKNIALNKNDLDGCMKVRAGTSRDFCYIDFAIKLLDPTICNLVSEDFKEDCLEYVSYTKSAVELRDSTSCNLITNYNYRDDCIEAVRVLKFIIQNP